jgi:phage terminase large subunit
MSAVRGYIFAEAGRTGVILAGREFMNSLDDSSMEEIKQAIRSVPWLDAYYEIGEKYIRTKNKRVKYVFAGLRHNLDSIKSKARILLAWIDEAEHVTDEGWRKLTPTVREEGSEIWVTWNPETDGSPTDQRFLKHPPKNSKIVQMNHRDNPWFTARLEEERQNDIARDPVMAAHIWEGEYLEYVDGAIYARELQQAREAGRITSIPIETHVGVNTFWDLGMNDTTCIWFMQAVGLEHRFIDYYENNGLPLSHYTRVLKDKGYQYNEHYLPHDVEVRDLSTGMSRRHILEDLGLQNIVTVERAQDLLHAIEVTRQAFPRCWFDKDRCKGGLKGLKNYRREYDEKRLTFRQKPLHNWASNPADAFRQYATGFSNKALGSYSPQDLMPDWAEDF